MHSDPQPPALRQILCRGARRVPGRGEAHDAGLVHDTRIVHVATRELEGELRLHGCRTSTRTLHSTSISSYVTTSFSVSTEVSPAFSEPISSDFGQACMIL